MDQNKFRARLNENTFSSEELSAVNEVMQSGNLTMGERCKDAERTFAALLGVKNAIFVNSGSSANLLALSSLSNAWTPEIKKNIKGTQVIVPALSWSTTVFPIVQVGATPVFVDCDPQTLQIDITKMKEAINEETSAIMPVHVMGNCSNMTEIMKVAEQHNLWVIEDTCEALGSRVHGQYAGSFSDISTFSFFFSHHISTIEGGMVCTNNDTLAEIVRCMRAHGWTRHLEGMKEKCETMFPQIDPRYLFVNLGYSLRPTEIQGAILLEQLKKLEQFNRSRVAAASSLNKLLMDLGLSGKLSVMSDSFECEPVLFGYPILTRSMKERDSLSKFLSGAGIETRPIIAGNMARHPASALFQKEISGSLVNSDMVMDCGIFLPCHQALSEEQILHMSKSIHEFYAKEEI